MMSVAHLHSRLFRPFAKCYRILSFAWQDDILYSVRFRCVLERQNSPEMAPQPHFCIIFSHAISRFLPIHSMDVRLYRLRTYVQATSGRTCIHSMDVRASNLWTYVQAGNPRERGKFIPLKGCFRVSENRPFAHEVILSDYFCLLSGCREVRM